MKPFLLIVGLSFFGAIVAPAEEPSPPTNASPTADALPPTDAFPPTNASPTADAAPVLVTGIPPEGIEVEKPPSSDAKTEPPAAPIPKAELAVHVEKLQTGQGNIDPSQIKLLAPFPAKPLAQPPSGWRLATDGAVTPLTREVELAPGTKITLTIRPHLLVPEADAAQTFAISEPGYDPALGYQQTATVGAILARSIRQFDEDGKNLGNAIERMQQLLVTLPHFDAAPEPASPTPQ